MASGVHSLQMNEYCGCWSKPARAVVEVARSHILDTWLELWQNRIVAGKVAPSILQR
jgi:hypothetical protein